MCIRDSLIVGVSLVAASTVEYRSSVNHGHSTQAFFVAEAGLNWARRSLRSGTIALPVISVGQEVVLYRNAAYGSPVVGQPVTTLDAVGPVEVRVRRLTANTLRIESRGRQHQAQRTVSMLITETGGAGSGSLPTSHHIRDNFTRQPNTTVVGSVTSGSAGFTYPNVIIPPVPTGLTWRSDLNVRNATTIAASGQYGTITVDGPLTITPGNTDLIIYAHRLEVGNKGSIQIGGADTDTGRVIIHISNSISLDGTIGSLDNVDRLQVIQHSNLLVEIQNSGIFHGSLITNIAPIHVHNKATVSGLLLTNSTHVGEPPAIHIHTHANIGTASQGVLLYAPNGTVHMHSNSDVYGVVVARNLHLQPNSTLTHNLTGVPSSAPFVTFGGGGTTFSFSNWNTQP